MCPSDTDSTCQSLWDHTAGTHRLCPSPSWAAVASTQGCAEPILTPTWQGGAAPPPPHRTGEESEAQRDYEACREGGGGWELLPLRPGPPTRPCAFWAQQAALL